MRLTPGHLFPILLALPACAATLARWEAGRPPRAEGIDVSAGPQDKLDVEGKNGAFVAALKPSGDYFRRAAFRVRVAGTATGPAWLSLEYPDSGYGLIAVTPPVRAADQSGVARLNTGRTRHAAIRLNGVTAGAVFTIEGLPRLRAVTLADAPPPAEPAPAVKPAIEFRTASQRITTAGADAPSVEQLPEALATMRNLLPLARALGFNGIESYVKWNFVERSPGVFDWSFYDAIVDEIEKQGLQWFPLLIVGSAYTLPEWYHDSPENVGFVCLEHRRPNDIQSIFCENQNKYVQRFLLEFGRHYGPRKALLGVRLGPSGNYGEAQYPATGAWGYKGGPIHTHQGYWAGDPYAAGSFRRWLGARYASAAELNKAWDTHFDSLEDVRPFLPITANTDRMRLDFSDWYMGAMSDWCDLWARWARDAMPGAVIHQSSGGWGAAGIGTDYSFQARGMARLHGGIRLTNEGENFVDNFGITRMAASAARFYNAELGFEPGGFGSARGVVARLYNALTNGAVHLFYYHPNLYANDQGIDKWLRYAPLFDRRAKPRIDVAAFYPDTALKLDEEVLRYRWGSVFFDKAQALRSVVDYDYVSEQMIADGALDRYKVLVFLWGTKTERPILERIGRWVEAGGVAIYPSYPRGLLETVEGDSSIARGWQQGRTGKGKAIFYTGEPTPGDYYARFVRRRLLELANLDPRTREALALEKPAEVYWSVLENGDLALLNFTDDPADIQLAGGRRAHVDSYGIWLGK